MKNESCKPVVVTLWPALDLMLSQRLGPTATAQAVGQLQARQRALAERHWDDLQHAFLPDEQPEHAA